MIIEYIALIENVKGLCLHRQGKTLTTILHHIAACGYRIITPRLLSTSPLRTAIYCGHSR
ncbi:MAG: hypothetical protein GY782_10535 [Gammaproteobacteria bacterium]|nr:hypothetical protein [Gammaproteobacteria bacterium]